ncbi:MAG TPA: type I methionyl aminopeptidase [Anaerolineae bacterium]|nr:type I methionyl aminopeptidase [Anaerolineae bacterium]
MITLKSGNELALMREAGRIVAEVLAEIQEVVAPGVTTADLEVIADRIIVGKHQSIPSFKGYRGFPGMVCASINDEIVHGIPGQRVLQEGDIISVDVGVIHKGYHGDAAITVGVGQVDAESQRLLEVTAESLRIGIQAAAPGRWTTDISKAIQAYVEAQGFSVVREYTGHGIGRQMHEDPQIPNYFEPKLGKQIRLRPGMTFALEPMVNVGDWRTRVLDDHWTVVTADGTRSAHFEHTVAVTKNGPEILTRL